MLDLGERGRRDIREAVRGGEAERDGEGAGDGDGTDGEEGEGMHYVTLGWCEVGFGGDDSDDTYEVLKEVIG